METNNITRIERKDDTPLKRLEVLVNNDKLTGEDVLRFIDDENYRLVERLATEDPETFEDEYAEFIDFYFDVFGFNDDFLEFVEESYEGKMPFIFAFSDNCFAKREVRNMSDYKKDNAMILADYIMSLDTDRSFSSFLSNENSMKIEIPENLQESDYEACKKDLLEVCSYFACYGGQAFLIYTDKEDKKTSVINGFMTIDGIMMNISANNMKNSLKTFDISNNEGKVPENVRLKVSPCIFKKPYNKYTVKKDDDDNGNVLHFPKNHLVN